MVASELSWVDLNSGASLSDGICGQTHVILSEDELDVLSNCAVIGGNLIIDGTELSRLGGLEGLTTIEGSLYITNNNRLTDLSGFSGLREVGGAVTIEGNERLEVLDAFDALECIGSSLSITGNPDLIELAGFGSLAEVHTLSIRVRLRRPSVPESPR